METMMSPTQYLDDVLEGDESEEELYTEDEEEGEITKEFAVLSWLRTFPQMENVEVDSSMNTFVKEWYQNETISIALLGVAAEICGMGCSNANGNVDLKQTNWKSIADSVNLVNYNCSPEKSDKKFRLSIFYALLCVAVSDNCEQKKSYVSCIMALDLGVKRVLMQIIKEGEDVKKSQSFRSPDPDESYLDDLNVDDDNESLLDDYEMNTSTNKENVRNSFGTPLSISTSFAKRTPMSSRSPKYSYRSPMANSNRNNTISMFSAGSCSRKSTKSTPLSISPHENNRMKIMQMDREASQLHDANEALCAELNTYRQQESVLRAKLEENEAKNRAAQLKIETDNLAATNELKDMYEERIASYERKLNKSEKMLENAAAVEEELYTLKDEVDILQSSKTKLFHTEEQLRKIKEKMEQMGDLNKALAQEEKAHGEAIAKCLELENSLAVLAPLKRQLEDYKTRATDAEVRLVDCEDEIRKLRQSSNNVSGLNKELQIGSLRQQAEVEDLRRKMQEDASALLDQDSNKVGEGMSELNPELKEELLRLRNENKRLTDFAAKREDDSVQMMEEKLDDANRLSAKFKDQFLSTKNTLEQTNALLEASSQREIKLQNEITQLNEEIRHLETVIDDERASTKLAAEAAANTLESTKQSMMDQHRIDLNNTVNEWKTRVNQVHSDWDTKFNKLISESEEKEKHHNRTVCELRDHTAKSLSDLESQRQEQIKQLETKREEEIQKMKAENDRDRDELIAKGKQMIQKMKHESDARIDCLEADVTKASNERQELLIQQKEYEQKVANKISTYRQKINVSQAEIRESSSACEELQTKLKKIEREKMTLQDENDRFRRQMNGRSGFDQGQYEELQREYNMLLDENQSLKNESNANQMNSDKFSSGFNGDETGVYSNVKTVSASSLSQLRAEYEEMMEELRDEKRQLVMKNSALITDEKRANQRSWDLEVQLKDFQEKNTSLQLQIERIDRNRSNSTIPKKRLASKISPRALATKASEAWRSSKVAKSSPDENYPKISSPSASTLPNLDLKSPEFRTSMTKFRKKLADRLSSAKKERSFGTFTIQGSSNSRNLNDDEWEFHIE